MGLLADTIMYSRFARGLPHFLRQRNTFTLEEARETLRRRLGERDEAFLRVLRKGIFGHPGSPYLPLLEMAGCELGDVERMVRARGLEETLGELYDAGVYVTFEELKGRAPIVRHGREIPVAAHDFDNPHLGYYYYTQTSGSTGVGTRISLDLNHILASTPSRIVLGHTRGTMGMPSVLWRGLPPAVAGLSGILRGCLTGRMPERWFTPFSGDSRVVALRHRVAVEYVQAVARYMGIRVPRPEFLALNRPEPILRWVVGKITNGVDCAVRGTVSQALRIAVAAAEKGIDLTGVTFMGAGEPPTPAKVKAIRDTGARYFCGYGAAEAGGIGTGCMNPLTVNDVHVRKDSIAVIQRPREVPGWNVSVNAFFFTSLMPTAPKLLLNAGLDDFGILETRSCGCPIEELGYTEHIRDIWSYGKLTGEGVTLVNTDVVSMLEEVLPGRFGGSPLDYQLAEEEDEGGFTRLSLRVHPRLPMPDEEELVKAVREVLSRGKHTAAMAEAMWGPGGSIRVSHAEPVLSAGGKFMPLYVAQSLRQASRIREQQAPDGAAGG